MTVAGASGIVAGRFTARAWLLFAVMSIVWGVPYLFIAQAVASFSPPAVVGIRTLGAGLLLLPFAARAGALRPALRLWPWVLLFGALEMAGPFLLLSHAELTIPSGTTGLLVATVPLFAALIGFFAGDRGALGPMRVVGLVVGFAGVAVVVSGSGIGLGDGGLFAVGEVLAVAVLYAIAPFVVATKLRAVPSLGTATLSLLFIGIGYLPFAVLTQHEVPTPGSILAIVLLTVVCTAVAFIAFFALIREVGPARAPLFTYVNPVVAIALGALVLGEHLHIGLLLGFPLVIAGCWLAATGGGIRFRRRPGAAPPVASD